MSRVLDVLHDDNHLLVVAKPAGLAVVPDASGDASLLDRARAWVKRTYAKPGEVFLGVVHRLDRPVSGVVVFARTSKAARRLATQWQARTVRKSYCGVLEHPQPADRDDGGRIEQWLRKDGRLNVVREVGPPAEEGEPGVKLARTVWRLRDPRGDRRLVWLEPETGRPHQLRVACSRRLRPLAGDLKYGAQQPLRDRSIALHARRLELDHPTRDERLVFIAPFPRASVWTPWRELRDNGGS